MDKLNKDISALIEKLKESSEYKKYILIKNKINEDNILKSKLEELKKLKKCSLEYKKLDEELNEYPIYLEYKYIKEDLIDQLNIIKEIIEKI